ncbi:MAG: FG-GAP repeat protein, partial [Halofilum sp. (in: g-proteobacteria)]|nr:FG-GAP repeat protein [Halofilum sp. (in: g-proteobacteria)]
MFVRDGGGSWSQQATFQASNAGATDRFGASVALSAGGDTLAVGAPLEDNGASTLPEGSFLLNAGAAYVFTRSGGSWSQQG